MVDTSDFGNGTARKGRDRRGSRGHARESNRGISGKTEVQVRSARGRLS